MAEPKELTAARHHLARAEAMLLQDDGLFHLQEGLALLDAVIDDGHADGGETIARNLGRTYADKIFARLERHVATSRPAEPELERAFAMLRAFDEVGFDLPDRARELKIEVVSRLVDFYSEGLTPTERAQLREQLAAVTGGRTEEQR